MIYELNIDKHAERDITELVRWYNQKQSGLGLSVLDELEGVFDLLKTQPEVYQVVYRHARRAILHRFPIIVCYIISGDEVQIFAVTHSKRHPESWQNRIN